MYTDLKWKIPLILFAILGSAYLAYPLKDKIALGLDLQGGMHLVLEVQTEKAVEASLERIADNIKREIEEEDYEVDRVRADIENKTITVLMVDAIDHCSSSMHVNDLHDWEKRLESLSEGSCTTLGAYHKSWQ